MELVSHRANVQPREALPVEIVLQGKYYVFSHNAKSFENSLNNIDFVSKKEAERKLFVRLKDK